MIKVENLTKRYAGQTAIRDLNFEVGQGEIMGFLGPNGAGKTTTMRILASFLPATSGRASIAGFDVFEQSLQARAHLGYMPENVPLYNDMRVSEYLNYRAALKSIPHRRVGERVGDVKELCGLREVENKLIRALSKGFRQRVGLADVLLHEPDLLILDDWGPEPLDADQRRDLLEIVEDRYESRSIIVTSQLPVDRWYEIIGNPTIADAILDRLVHNAYRIELKGESLRKQKQPAQDQPIS